LPDLILDRQLVAQVSLLGMGLDALGGCYLAYDLLGGKRGPLRVIARAAGYITLFFIGYFLVLGLRYATIASFGMGILLALEYRYVEKNEVRKQVALGFGFLRGIVLGLAGMAFAGAAFGLAFGLLSGAALFAANALGFSPTYDYEMQARPRLSSHRILASVLRTIVVSAAGIGAAFICRDSTDTPVLLGVRVGVAAGTVSALVGLFSPAIEWRIENIEERRLGLAGLGLIFVGMALQSVQYWVVVFNVQVR